MKILYVDDCGLELKLVSAVVSTLGDHELIKVKTKKEVLATLLKTSDIDLIVTDFFMKNETGLDVVKMVKQLNYDIPVVMLTSAPTKALPTGKDAELFDGVYKKDYKVKSLWSSIIEKFKPMTS